MIDVTVHHVLGVLSIEIHSKSDGVNGILLMY